MIGGGVETIPWGERRFTESGPVGTKNLSRSPNREADDFDAVSLSAMGAANTHGANFTGPTIPGANSAQGEHPQGR
jgi:hypothetical protein